MFSINKHWMNTNILVNQFIENISLGKAKKEEEEDKMEKKEKEKYQKKQEDKEGR